MVFLGFSPYFIFTSFLTTLLLDRGVHTTGDKQFPTSSPWYPSAPSPANAKTSNNDAEALKKVLPLVTFDCRGKTGYFPDAKFNCEVFHYCQPDGARNTFHCPAYQLFNQLSMVCEERNSHNSKLCREGSINPVKLQKFPNSKKYDSLQKVSPIFKLSLNSTESPKKIMTLEDLLSYMNSGHNGREAEPTFISRFYKAEEPQKSKATTKNSAITTSKPETKLGKDKKPSKVIDSPLDSEGSAHTFTVTKSSSKSTLNNKKPDDDLSTEYDAIEGRKLRKHKRVGRILEAEDEAKKEKEKKPHSHMTERSASEAPKLETTTLPSTDDTEPRNSSVSLFTSDRNKSRKRKRYQGRKRKPTTPGTTGSDANTESGLIATTTLPTLQTARQDFDTMRNNAYRRRKSQRPRTRDESHKGHKTEKVEPYTLPPLPTPSDEKMETTTESMLKETKGRSKNPWHKQPQPTSDDDGLKFGEKLSDLDQHHYETHAKIMEGPAPPVDFYGTKDAPNASEELLGEEYRERISMHSKNSADLRSNHRSKAKTIKKYKEEDDDYRYVSLPENPSPTISENIFPPPRAESREHHSTPSQQMINHESKEDKHKSRKATTEDPFRVTYPYIDKYQSGVPELKDLEEHRWKTNSDKTQSNDKKVEVGSTFFFQNPVTPETTKKPRLQVPPTTETPVTDSIPKETNIPKHTLAHQHLSKIMNDFFAMSSSNLPGRVHADSHKNEDIIVPEYRIPDEDIYTGSESVSEDVEEIPPELLEVVDFITGGNTGGEKSDLKPRSSHEIIKINGPITDSHIEKIFLDEKFDEEYDQRPSEDGSFKKIVVIPQPEENEENREEEELEEITSLKLEPFLKQFTEEKSLTVIPLKAQPVQKRQPTILTAKKLPVRIIYRDQLVESIRPKPSTRKPNIKMVQMQQTSPRMKIISHNKRQNIRPFSQSFTSHSQPSIILHPPSLYPPHPPPLHKKQYPFRVGYPFVTNARSHVQNTRPIHSRRKRSIINRLRRQIHQNQQFLPFSGPAYPSFNPKFVPTFTPFKALFGPSIHTAGSHLTSYTFPGFPHEKSSQRPRIYRPNHPRPPPVRHVTQNGHQTVIVEEVPVPIHVEVPSPNLMHSAPSGGSPSKLPPRYPGNQFRAPSPPAIQTPPLIQRPQYRFPPPPNSFRPLGMPANAGPMSYRSPIPLTGPLPPRITSQGQLYALGVTNKPILPPANSQPPRPPNGAPKPPPRAPPRPYNPFDIHPSAYPNFPYFQGAFTTPISNEPVPGRIMYSGYKPPKSTTGTKPPTKSNKERKPSESNSNRSRSKPSQDYYEAPAKPMRESHVSYTEEILSRGRPKVKQSMNDYSIDQKELPPPRHNLNKYSSSDEVIQRKRRPGRRRRPRPYSTTTQNTLIQNEISPTPRPPEQIPPPPADYTSKPSQHEVLSSLPSYSEGTKAQETSSNFPPAGYYGKDQLIQFFDSSSKPQHKTTSPKPYHLKSLGESRATAELDDSMSSVSIEDGNEPAFGTRLRAKPGSQSRNRQEKHRQPPRSQTQKNEIRTRPNMRQEEPAGDKKITSQTQNNDAGKTQTRQQRPPPRRRRPPRPRNRPPAMARPQPEVHHFNYNQNLANFYSVPPGLQNLVAPEHQQQGFRGSTDMFGLPHPVIDQNIYSLRPQGAPVDFDTNFFSVPAHVAQQQQTPLHKMNIKPVPESHREFFTAAEKGSSAVPEASTPEKKETEQRNVPNKSEVINNEKRDPPARKLRKPKRKNRYNPHSTEQKDSTEVNSGKSTPEHTTPRDSSTARYRDKSTTLATTTTTMEPYSTAASTNNIKTSHYHSQNDIKESTTALKQRNPTIPKTLPELSKSLLNGKIDIKKLNATISTSVSVSGAVPQSNASSEEKESKRVFSSQNGGGLAVVKKGPKRKRARQRVSTTTGVPYVNNESDAKYEIAASVLDIIKATTETERQASGYYDSYKNEKPSSSRVTNTWVENPNKRHHA